MLTDFKLAPVSLAWQESFGLWLHRTPTRKARQRSKLTLEAYLRDARLFAAYFERVNAYPFSPELLNTTDLTAYFQALAKQGKPATYNRKLASLRMLIAWARAEGLLEYDPAAWISFMDATRESPRDIQEEERLRLEKAVETGSYQVRENDLLHLRDLLIFQLMNCAGLRTHEVVGLRRDDLHLEDGYIHVLGKGQKHRKTRVAGRLVVTIREWLSRGPAPVEGTLITDENGQPITRGQAWRRFVMVAEAAEVQASPHGLRHTYVYRYMDRYMAGDQGKLPAAIDAICQQTGDRPEVILAYYTRARESDMRAVAEEM